MTETRYFLTRTLRDRTDARAVIIESMEAYDPRDYRPDIEAGKADEVAREEWENVWQPNGVDVFHTHEAAEAARANDSRAQIVAITLDDVSDALTRLFGAG